MSLLAEKHNTTVDEAVAHLISRAGNSRGLSDEDVRPRVALSLEKYLLKVAASVDHREIREFVAEIRIDDLCLILACERGDEAAWSELVASFDSTVKSAARKICSNVEDADDLAGSIWAELYGLRTDAGGNKKSKLAYYSGRGSLGGWLRAVVAQLAIDQFRKQSKFVQVDEDREFENFANDAAHSDNGFIARAENPEDEFTSKETSADVAASLAKAVAALDAEDRLILKLYYFDDLKLKQIAEMAGYHEATASRRLTRLQTDIRKSVEKQLKSQHGWTDAEVKRHLSETAAGLGVNLETMFVSLTLAVLVQDFWFRSVL